MNRFHIEPHTTKRIHFMMRNRRLFSIIKKWFSWKLLPILDFPLSQIWKLGKAFQRMPIQIDIHTEENLKLCMFWFLLSKGFLAQIFLIIQKCYYEKKEFTVFLPYLCVYWMQRDSSNKMQNHVTAHTFMM